MDFTESVKLDAKRRANFQCVICRRAGFFLHVHHITPQEEGGPGDLDNAAPLCVECHDLHGGDPGKRKWIREVRDWWWDYCAKRAAQPDVTAAFERLDRLQTELLAVKEGQARSGEEPLRRWPAPSIYPKRTWPSTASALSSVIAG